MRTVPRPHTDAARIQYSCVTYREFCQIADFYPAGVKFALVLLQPKSGVALSL